MNRPDLNDDFVELLSALVEARVEFIIVGAHALAAHGVLRATGDLDVLVRPSPENAARVISALRAFGAPLEAHGVSQSDFEANDTVYQIGLPPRRIDLLTSISGVPFDEAWATKLDVELSGLDVSVIGFVALVKNKRATGRPKDVLDADALERREAERSVTPKDLATHEGKPIALGWMDAAIAALGRPDDALTAAALAINFSASTNLHQIAAEVRDTYEKAKGILLRSDRYFVGVSEDAARRFFPGDIPPAYAIFEEAIYFTPRFEPYDPATGRGFGPMCRAAMVLHETIHVIDPESGTPDVHISEWDEPGFSTQTLDESLHNPSAYASFAAQVHERAIVWPRELRFGAGRRKD